MNILMFGWELPPHNSGGLGVACMGLTKSLARKGAHVTFVLPKKIPVEAPHMRVVFADVPDIPLPESIYRPDILGSGVESRPQGGSLYQIVSEYSKRGRVIAKKYPADVIHAHDWLSCGAGIAAKKETGKPLVMHIHNTEVDRAGGTYGNKYIHDFENLCFSEADRIVAVSHHTKDTVVKHYGVSEEKIDVIHNGVEKENHNTNQTLAKLSVLKEKHKIVLFLGRFTLHKGPDYFVEVAQKVLHYVPDATFLMVGSGEMEGQLMSDVASRGLSDKILFPGFVRGAERDALYEIADLFVLPSVSEPFGIAPLEALLLHTPVLISKQCGVSEVLTHALKADFWDTDEMTNKIVSLLSHETLARELATHGKTETEGITWDKSAEKCLSLYNELIPYTI